MKPDCVAPGTRIIAATPLALSRTLYHIFDCTSYAVPHVTGTLALPKEAYPNVSAAGLKQAIMAGCETTRSSLLSRAVGGSSLRKRLASRVRMALTSQADPRWSAGTGRINALESYEPLKNESNQQTSTS